MPDEDRFIWAAWHIALSPPTLHLVALCVSSFSWEWPCNPVSLWMIDLSWYFQTETKWKVCLWKGRNVVVRRVEYASGWYPLEWRTGGRLVLTDCPDSDCRHYLCYITYGIGHKTLGILHVVYGRRYLAYYIWHKAHGITYMAYGIQDLEYYIWHKCIVHLEYDIWDRAYDTCHIT